MAGTALTSAAFTKKAQHSIGDLTETVYNIAFNSSYTPGGYAVSARQVGLTTGISEARCTNTGGYVVDPQIQTDGTVLLKVLTSNGAAPAALTDFTSAGDLSAVTAARCRFLGK